MPINNEWTKNKNFNMNYNNDDNENKSKSTLIILALITIVIIGIYTMYNQEQKEIQKQNEIDKETLKIIKEKKLEEQRALNSQIRQQNQTYNQNYNNYKYFKINYEYEKAEDIYDRDFRINMDMITKNLGNIKSRSDDNDYDIEISGNISKYGGMFYRIYKRKQSSEYDNEIINILNELKKYKFRIQEESINFKIYMNNNSMNLNYK